VLWIGLAQACALIPGISRSGATIGAGRLLGWSWSEAARFSFLLSIPAILGGHLLEGVKQLGAGGTLPWSALAVGCGAAALAGSVGVRAVFWAYERGKVAPFGYYCLALGLTWIIVAGQW
jgi:undecaprenyl-diphosphatase